MPAGISANSLVSNPVQSRCTLAPVTSLLKGHFPHLKLGGDKKNHFTGGVIRIKSNNTYKETSGPERY